MKRVLKRTATRLFSVLGLKISRINREQDEHKWLKDLSICTIIDVGASKGNSILQFRKMFPEAEIYAFEPIRDYFERISGKCKDMPGIKIFNLALSDKKGPDIIHRSPYSGSSSLRNMADLHKKAFPVTAGGHDEKIETDTMDNVLGKFDLKDNILVKIDVQGLEDKVILGGQKTIGRAKVVIVETSFVELYEGQPLFGKVHELLSNLGFEYSGAWDPDFRNPLDGSSLQQDSIFIRKT